MSNLKSAQECELCLERDKHSPANRELGGVWVCVDCIVQMNTDELRKADPPRPEVAAPETSIGSAIKRPPTTNARNLATVLAQTMEGLLAGKIDTPTALAVCKISSEAVKVMDLIWRMNR